MILRTLALFSFLLALGLAGCESTDIKREQASQREDLHRLEEKVGFLEADLGQLQTENENLQAEITRVRKDLVAARAENSQYEKDINRLDGLVQKLDTAREQDRKIIVDEVTREIGRLSKKLSSQPSAAPGEAPKGKVEHGVEHTVAKGETLYAIARAYGISVQEIQEANKLGSTSLKVGQKLFIPER